MNEDELNVEFLRVLGREREEGGELDLDTQVASAALEYLEEKGVGEIEIFAVSQLTAEDVKDRYVVYEDGLMLVTVDHVEYEEDENEDCYGIWMKV